ncbi:MAG: glycosyltransferase [Ktedonobacteraceae bacterium]
MNMKSVFIVWFFYSLRAESMAAELGGQVSYQYEVGLKRRGLWLIPLRYLVQGWKTWRFLEQEQPEVVLVQVPPIFAALVVAFWCSLRGKTRPFGRKACYVIDSHTAAFHHHDWRWARPLLRLLSRRAVATLVTDEAALDMLKSWKAKGIFLVNGLPTLSPPTGLIGLEGELRVAVISTFSDNEPIEEVFAAAQLLPHVTFYLTGNSGQAPATLLSQKPDNVILTGFLLRGNYTGLLKNVHGLVILTKEPNDLSCGSYEALAMAKPVVASNGPEMRRFFTRGFIFVDNTPQAIADGIKQMLNEREMLTTEVIAMRSLLETKRRPNFEELTALLK